VQANKGAGWRLFPSEHRNSQEPSEKSDVPSSHEGFRAIERLARVGFLVKGDASCARSVALVRAKARVATE
jgi:hypothetical protein